VEHQVKESQLCSGVPSEIKGIFRKGEARFVHVEKKLEKSDRGGGNRGAVQQEKMGEIKLSVNIRNTPMRIEKYTEKTER